MAGGQYLSGHQQKIVKRYYNQLDNIVANRLAEVVSDLAINEDPKKAAQLWQRAQEALLKTSADKMRVAKIVSTRSVEQLAKLVGDLVAASKVVAEQTAQQREAEAKLPPIVPVQPVVVDAAAPVATGGATGSGTGTGPNPSGPDVQKQALIAFKKRLKYTQLEADSKLSRSFLTGGRTTIAAIQPPNTFSRAVWEQLVKDGKLKYDGSGLYRLP